MDEPLRLKDLQPWHPRSAEVMQRLGRNMLMFQLVEAYVKFLVPYAHPRGARTGDKDFARLRSEVSDKSLGPALQMFKESIAHDSDIAAADFDRYTREVVDARNKMTHGLLSLPGFSLQTEQGCQAVIKLLNEHLDLLQTLLQLVAGNAALVGNACGHIDDEAIRAFIEAMGGKLEVFEYDPAHRNSETQATVQIGVNSQPRTAG